MKRNTMIATLFASLLGAGTAFAAPGRPTPAPAHRPVLVRPAATTVWTKLGETMINGRRGGSVITLGRRGEIVTRLRIDVKRGDAALRAVRITFANGTHYVANVNDMLSAYSRPLVIDLPGQARAVRSVELISAGGRRFSRALVEVSGDKARFGPYAYR